MKKIAGNSKRLPCFMAMLLSILVTACGGGGQSPILGAGSLSPVPVVPLTVTAVSPLPNTLGVAINTRVLSAAFSQSMNPATLSTTSFTLACPTTTPIAGAAVSYVAASKIATLTLPVGTMLPVNTVCTTTITTAAKNSTGLALVSNYIWSWTTALATDTTAPRVISTVHANNAINVPVNTRIDATFSEALNPLTLTNINFSMKQTVSGAAVTGTTSYSGVDALFIPLNALTPGTQYTMTLKGGAGGVEDLAANPMAVDYVWSWTTVAADVTAPLVTLVSPANLATNVATSTAVNATFNEAIDPLTISNASFTLAGVTGVAGSVSFNALTKIATFTPNAALTAGTIYTATVTTGVTDLAGNNLALNKVWSFTTAAIPIVIPVIALNTAAPYGTFGGTAGMTNTGTLTQVNGDIGTIATGTSMVTGFHDTLGDIYTESPANIGAVNGRIYTCTNATTGPNSAVFSVPNCAIATQARLDAQTAYLALVAKPVGGASPAPGANLAGLTLLPGTYVAPGGSFMIQGGNLTLDAQGDANATWVFQMATTLTVGGPGAAFPQSIILAGGALPKNVFWQVGSFATINAAGGGTMVGTIISQAGTSFSTAGNVNIVTLEGRALSLGASVTLVDTVINVPAP
ncbi:hypothetical protein MIZ03_2675 [Rhodoferax lithotrophicus]|uniref:SbsA Ig-like domain-containing protein n=2 Tax=Rhodoferax lithotrophicus TaxID=2798804 RepID=A0ABN6DA06_9BURK|nr:hypothetical protein MIZ03_2675 [Rhodoferax sp. MIZ03]